MGDFNAATTCGDAEASDFRGEAAGWTGAVDLAGEAGGSIIGEGDGGG